MDRTQLYTNGKQPQVATLPSWLGSALVHLLIVAVVLKVGTLTPTKNDIVWVSLSNIVMRAAEPVGAPQKKIIEPPHSAVPATVPEAPLVKADNREERMVPEKQPEQQPQAENITIEPKVSQPKPPVPLKIRKADKVKQKFSKPTDRTNISLGENQLITAPVSPVPTSSARAVLPVKNQLPDGTEEIPEAAQEKYLQVNFSGIRSKVSDNLRYPAMARRQGWHGQVQVKFIILLSGEVADLQVLSSSGYSLLDRQALQAVKIAAPFPAPPVVASITIPVTFEIN